VSSAAGANCIVEQGRAKLRKHRRSTISLLKKRGRSFDRLRSLCYCHRLSSSSRHNSQAHGRQGERRRLGHDVLHNDVVDRRNAGRIASRLSKIEDA
jgi:hypothetical protein